MTSPRPILPDLSHNLQRAGERLYDSGSGVETTSIASRKRYATIAATLAAAAATATIAFFAGAGSDPHATALTAKDHPPFAVLGLPATPGSAESLPAPSAAPGITREDAHRLSVDGHSVWVTSGGGDSCLFLATEPGASATACGATSDAMADGLFVTSRPAPGASGAPWRLAGLLPDGVERVSLTLADGTTTTLSTQQNVIVGFLDTTPTTARFSSPDGHDHVQKLGAL
jgi:hypothetical protein